MCVCVCVCVCVWVHVCYLVGCTVDVVYNGAVCFQIECTAKCSLYVVFDYTFRLMAEKR